MSLDPLFEHMYYLEAYKNDKYENSEQIFSHSFSYLPYITLLIHVIKNVFFVHASGYLYLYISANGPVS